jgi:hypothetical protein
MKPAWYDLTFAAGVLCITGGLSLWSLPVAVIVAGLALCAVSLRAAHVAKATAASTPADFPSRPVSHDRTADQAAA